MIALDGSEKFVYNIISFVCRRCTCRYSRSMITGFMYRSAETEQICRDDRLNTAENKPAAFGKLSFGYSHPPLS